MGKCAKCNEEINHNAGFYNFPSGAMCAQCGKARSASIMKALDKEITKELSIINEINKPKAQ